MPLTPSERTARWRKRHKAKQDWFYRIVEPGLYPCGHHGLDAAFIDEHDRLDYDRKTHLYHRRATPTAFRLLASEVRRTKLWIRTDNPT